MQVFNALAPLADAFEVELPARLLQPAASHERADQRAIASSRAPIPGSDEFDHALAQLDDCVRYLLAHVRGVRDARAAPLASLTPARCMPAFVGALSASSATVEST